MEMQSTYQKELQEMQEDVVRMGNMVENAIGQATEALKKRDLKLGLAGLCGGGGHGQAILVERVE